MFPAHVGAVRVVTTPLACSACSRTDAPNYFKVTRVSREGVESHMTVVCSAACMMRWTYSFTTMQGARLVYGAKNAWEQAKASWEKLLGGK